jgi:hypothetical protein
MLGVPVPDATQWDQIEQVGDCAYVVFAQMEQVAAQGELIFQDDTAVRILSLIRVLPATVLDIQPERTKLSWMAFWCSHSLHGCHTLHICAL